MDTLIALKKELMFLESASKTLALSTKDLATMYDNIAIKHNLGSYVAESQTAKPLSTLLKEHNSSLTVQSFKRKALKAGLIKIQPWPHKTRPGKFKNRVILTDKGKTYGVMVDTSAQPLWFANTFKELLEQL